MGSLGDKFKKLAGDQTRQLLQNFQNAQSSKSKNGYSYGKLNEDGTATLAGGTTVQVEVKGRPGQYAPVFNLGNGQGLVDQPEAKFFNVDSTTKVGWLIEQRPSGTDTVLSYFGDPTVVHHYSAYLVNLKTLDEYFLLDSRELSFILNEGYTDVYLLMLASFDSEGTSILLERGYTAFNYGSPWAIEKDYNNTFTRVYNDYFCQAVADIFNPEESYSGIIPNFTIETETFETLRHLYPQVGSIAGCLIMDFKVENEKLNYGSKTIFNTQVEYVTSPECPFTPPTYTTSNRDSTWFYDYRNCSWNPPYPFYFYWLGYTYYPERIQNFISYGDDTFKGGSEQKKGVSTVLRAGTPQGNLQFSGYLGNSPIWVTIGNNMSFRLRGEKAELLSSSTQSAYSYGVLIKTTLEAKTQAGRYNCPTLPSSIPPYEVDPERAECYEYYDTPEIESVYLDPFVDPVTEAYVNPTVSNLVLSIDPKSGSTSLSKEIMLGTNVPQLYRPAYTDPIFGFRQAYVEPLPLGSFNAIVSNDSSKIVSWGISIDDNIVDGMDTRFYYISYSPFTYDPSSVLPYVQTNELTRPICIVLDLEGSASYVYRSQLLQLGFYPGYSGPTSYPYIHAVQPTSVPGHIYVVAINRDPVDAPTITFIVAYCKLDSKGNFQKVNQYEISPSLYNTWYIR